MLSKEKANNGVYQGKTWLVYLVHHLGNGSLVVTLEDVYNDRIFIYGRNHGLKMAIPIANVRNMIILEKEDEGECKN